MIREAVDYGADAKVNIRCSSSTVVQGAEEILAYGNAVKFRIDFIIIKIKEVCEIIHILLFSLFYLNFIVIYLICILNNLNMQQKYTIKDMEFEDMQRLD